MIKLRRACLVYLYYSVILLSVLSCDYIPHCPSNLKVVDGWTVVIVNRHICLIIKQIHTNIELLNYSIKKLQLQFWSATKIGFVETLYKFLKLIKWVIKYTHAIMLFRKLNKYNINVYIHRQIKWLYYIIGNTSFFTYYIILSSYTNLIKYYHT